MEIRVIFGKIATLRLKIREENDILYTNTEIFENAFKKTETESKGKNSEKRTEYL